MDGKAADFGAGFVPALVAQAELLADFIFFNGGEVVAKRHGPAQYLKGQLKGNLGAGADVGQDVFQVAGRASEAHLLWLILPPVRLQQLDSIDVEVDSPLLVDIARLVADENEDSTGIAPLNIR